MMNEKHVFIYLNANNEIGSGHFWRCLNIANELVKYNIEITFIYSSLSPVLLEKLTANNYSAYEINSMKPDSFIQVITAISNNKGASLLIIDSDNIWFYEKEFQLAIIGSGIRLMIITVNPGFHYYAHILLNQNIIACYQDYITESYTHKLFGPEYFIFSRQFRKLGMQSVKELGKNIFIAFGSADPCHYTLQLVDQIFKAKNLNNFNLHIIVGELNREYQKIRELCEVHSDRARLYYNIADIFQPMLQCNLSICSPGLMYWELALMGVRSVLFSSSSREKIIATFLHDNEFAYTFHHYDEIFSEGKFKRFENLLLNLKDEHFNNFSFLRKKLNPEGVTKIGAEINNLFASS